MKRMAKISVSALMWAGMAALSSCGGSSYSGTPTPQPTSAADYAIGGTVNGLFGAKSQITLENNGADATTVSANGSFAFAKKIQGGDAYGVTVMSEPADPPQNCTVSSGSGTVAGDVNSVKVSCAAPANYTVGGTVTGLVAGSDGVVLEDNGGDAVAVTADGTFSFGTSVTASEPFDVTVKTQPQHPIQICTAANASGTISANVTTVVVSCAAPMQYTVSGAVENLSGTNAGLTLRLNGQYIFSPGQSGTFMFLNTVEGGEPYDVTILQQPTSPAQICSVENGTGVAMGNVTNLMVDCGHKEWGWIAGSTATGQEGVYGTKGVAAAGNSPGARQNPVTWTDVFGNLWMFGGYGFDSIGALEPLNDLWKFSNGEWTWMGGSNLAGGSGVYGSLGVSSPANIPGARFETVFWSTGNGDVWMFGGNGFDSVGTEAEMNDLWKFSNGEWTWMGGSKLAQASGTYGTEGTASPANAPAAREQAMGWVDASGNLWLFGGLGLDASGTQGSLNDLWQYANGEWTWTSGASAVNQNGVYGTQGVASVSNVPGGRGGGLGWADGSGDFWVFAGAGFPESGSSVGLGDLWKYSNGEWTWEAGSNQGFDRPNYGTQGVASTSNTPGEFEMATGATDANGNFWMFGGNGWVTNSTAGDVDNLWEFSNGEWTWVTGTAAGSTMGVYGTKGVFAPSNVVGGRINTGMWIDGSGNIWMLGGWGFGTAATEFDLSDMWEYKF